MNDSRLDAKILVGWLVIARVLAGLYWLYFGVQKWSDYSWVRDTLMIAAQNNPIPTYRELLSNFVLPNWQFITILETAIETLIGIGLILGLFSRLCGFLGVFIAANLTLAMGFSFPDFALVFWYYALSLILNLTVLLSNTGRAYGIDRFILKRFQSKKILRLVV